MVKIISSGKMAKPRSFQAGPQTQDTCTIGWIMSSQGRSMSGISDLEVYAPF